MVATDYLLKKQNTLFKKIQLEEVGESEVRRRATARVFTQGFKSVIKLACKRLISVGVFLSVPLACYAQQPSLEKVKAAFQGRLDSSTQIKGVASTPLPGIYEINLGTEIVYTDATLRYIFQGNLIDLARENNLTEARLAELNRIKFSEFPLDQAVLTVRGKGTRKIVVFSDPNCGYCKRLESSLQAVDNLAIYTFLLPILSADSATKSRQVWCAADRGKVWQDWMLRNIAPTGDGKCATPLEKNMALANKLSVKATPAIFFTDGSRIPGAVPVATIERKLSEIYK